MKDGATEATTRLPARMAAFTLSTSERICLAFCGQTTIALAAQDAFVRNDLRPVFREADGLHGAMADALVAVFAIAFF